MKRKARPLGSLEALSQHGSSARLLNLARVGQDFGWELEYRTKPFFMTPLLNTCLVVKHSLRPHERSLFRSAPFISTKVIIPFDRKDLALGGRTIFVGQQGWREQLADLTDGAPHLERDCKLLEALDELPSLDPFLVREHLNRRGFEVAACYLAIAPADVERMQRSVSAEIDQLIGLAMGGEANSAATAKLVQLLLTNEADAALEPLRVTLRLEGDAYREGIFSWKGFLYYKWVIEELRLNLLRVTTAIRDLRPVGECTMEASAEIAKGKAALVTKIVQSERAAVAALQIYDGAFRTLIKHSNPIAFRDFLLRSPKMFLGLGECVGGVSHITSYWTYRFPEGAPAASTEELLEILNEFNGSLPAEPSELVSAA